MCDRIKSSLSDVCLKYILSVECGRTKESVNWLPLEELTDSVDCFVAAKGESVKPRAQFLGQNNSFRGSRPENIGVRGAKGDVKRFGQTVCTPKPMGAEQKDFGPHFQTPVKPVVCFECQKPGHIRSNCPTLKGVANRRVTLIRSGASDVQRSADRPGGWRGSAEKADSSRHSVKSDGVVNTVSKY